MIIEASCFDYLAGIINRDQRHNVGLFQSVFSPNPFDQVTDDELERYKRNVERKAKGLPTEEEEEEMERRKRTATLEATTTSVASHPSSREFTPFYFNLNIFLALTV